MNQDRQEELLPLVDENGNITGAATRGECHNGSMLMHPVVHLHVFNGKGELYLQKRPEWKDIQPGKWDTAVGGHINYDECLNPDGSVKKELGDSIMTALRREAQEELGISGFTPVYLGTYIFEGPREREQVFAYSTVYDQPITPSTEELASGRFWSRQELHDAIGQGILTPNFEDEYLNVVMKDKAAL